MLGMRSGFHHAFKRIFRSCFGAEHCSDFAATASVQNIPAIFAQMPPSFAALQQQQQLPQSGAPAASDAGMPHTADHTRVRHVRCVGGVGGGGGGKVMSKVTRP